MDMKENPIFKPHPDYPHGRWDVALADCNCKSCEAWRLKHPESADLDILKGMTIVMGGKVILKPCT